METLNKKFKFLFKEEFGYLSERSHNLGLNLRYRIKI
jgi:protein-arginine kinase